MTQKLSRHKTIVRAIRVVWAIAERWAPALGARVATRLWFTVPTGSRADPEPRCRSKPGPPGERITLDVDGRRLAGRTWGVGPPVYLVHGWGGRSEQLGGFVAPLVAAGHRVVAVDAPSHGGSEPGRWGRRRSAIPELTTTLQAAVAAHGRPHAVIAHSLGCTAVALAVGEGLRPAKLVFLAPVADPRRLVAGFADQAGFGPRIRAGLERAAVRRIGLPWQAFDVPAMAAVMPTPPVLVVHDRADREVDVRHGGEIAAAWPRANLLATDGLGHRRLLRDAGVIADVLRYVTAPGDHGAARVDAVAGRGSP